MNSLSVTEFIGCSDKVQYADLLLLLIHVSEWMHLIPDNLYQYRLRNNLKETRRDHDFNENIHSTS